MTDPIPVLINHAGGTAAARGDALAAEVEAGAALAAGAATVAGAEGARRPLVARQVRPPAASAEPAAPMVRSEKKVGRNEPCPCGSGKKYKQCHGRLD